jgi:hypothetical protein
MDFTLLCQKQFFFINRLPTPVLGGKSPYEMLFGKPPDYSHFWMRLLSIFSSLQ